MPVLSVRLKLAAVWTALMFLFVYADLLSFFRPGELDDISAGNMGPVDVSQGSLLIAAIVVTIPALMIVVSAAAPFPWSAGSASEWASSTFSSVSATSSVSPGRTTCWSGCPLPRGPRSER